MIELNNIQADRDGFQLSIDKLSLKKGDFIAVLGNNGSGKSTFFSLLSGFLPFQGEYRLMNAKMRSFDIKKRNRLLGLLSQKTTLNMPFDVFYVILTGRFPLTNGYQYSKDDLEATENVMQHFDIQHLRSRSFNKLSGGEKQRVLLARILNRQTPILLLDEPLNGIDLKHQHETIGHLKQSKNDKITLVVMHDLSLALREFDRFLIFSNGSLVYDTPGEQLNAQKLADIFDITVDFITHDQKLFVYTTLNTNAKTPQN